MEAAERHGAIMMIDDAHSSGVLGRNGRGTVDHFNLHGRVHIQVGTLSKAIGVLGGYVCGSRDLIEFLYHRARPFLFSTSHPPGVAASCMAAFDVLEQEPERIRDLWDNTKYFKRGWGRWGSTPAIERDADYSGDGGGGGAGAPVFRGAVRRGRVRYGDRVSDGAAGQGAGADDRDGDAHARAVGPGAGGIRARGEDARNPELNLAGGAGSGRFKRAAEVSVLLEGHLHGAADDFEPRVGLDLRPQILAEREAR